MPIMTKDQHQEKRKGRRWLLLLLLPPALLVAGLLFLMMNTQVKMILGSRTHVVGAMIVPDSGPSSGSSRMKRFQYKGVDYWTVSLARHRLEITYVSY